MADDKNKERFEPASPSDEEFVPGAVEDESEANDDPEFDDDEDDDEAGDDEDMKDDTEAEE